MKSLKNDYRDWTFNGVLGDRRRGKYYFVYYGKNACRIRDVLIRDAATDRKIQEEYINFLRGLFKGTEPTKYIQLVFLTGILPVKKRNITICIK